MQRENDSLRRLALLERIVKSNGSYDSGTPSPQKQATHRFPSWL